MALKKVYTALKRMRELSADNVPFSFSFQSWSSEKNETNGVKTVGRAFLRTGFSQTKSKKANILIGYYDLDKEKNGWAYLPLILTFNGTSLR